MITHMKKNTCVICGEPENNHLYGNICLDSAKRGVISDIFKPVLQNNIPKKKNDSISVVPWNSSAECPEEINSFTRLNFLQDINFEIENINKHSEICEDTKSVNQCKIDDKAIMPRDFNDAEIKEIHKYLRSNVPYSILQKTLPITDNAMEKTEIYLIIYRFINGFKNYVQDEETRNKLINLLEKNKEVYSNINKLYLTLDNNRVEYGKSRIKNRIIDIYKDYDSNMKINDFIDIFLVFAEKQDLINIKDTTGYNLETEEGKDAFEKLNKSSE